MTTNPIYFIDSRVADYQRLIAALPVDSKAFLLNPDQDGIEQMRMILSNYSELDSVQVISHGTQGALYLGNTVLTRSNIDQYRSELSEIGSRLTADGDLLLYGCDVAQGETGRQFIDRLVQLTGADVAASDDATGNAVFGGDWELEAAAGVIETASQVIAYSGLLGMTVSPNTKSDQGRTSGEHQNYGAFAALKADGSVVTWGYSSYGGDSSSVAGKLNGTVDVTQIYSTELAFAALKADGSVVTWGEASAGGDSSSVAGKLDGTVDVTQIYSTGTAFAALRIDGSVVTWGNFTFGGDSSSVAGKLNGTVDVTQIYSTGTAFAALRADGSVVAWGGPYSGGDSSRVASKLDGTVDVTQIYSTAFAFAALKADGSVVTWGDSSYGGDSSSVSGKLDGIVDVTQIYSTAYAFSALRADGSVVTWGDSSYGGDSSRVAGKLNGAVDVTQIYSTELAFAALRADGSVVTWGYSSYGGDSSSVAGKLDGTVDVTHIYSAMGAFAALRADGSVVTWGDPSYGGDSSRVASQLSSGVVGLADIYTDDFYTADPVWQISPDAVVKSEADGSIQFTITRPDDRLAIAETVYISTTRNHGSDNVGDYTGLENKPYTFGVGDKTSTPITVNILPDSIAEPDETFGLIVQTKPTDPLTIYLASTTFTIQDSVVTPPGEWRITPDDIVASEADGKIEFTITRPDDRLGIAETVYVSTTRNHGSDNVGDYTGLENKPYTFGVGDKTSTPITVNILPDSIAEPDETFGLIVQTNPTDPLTTYLASTMFTIEDSVVTPPGEWRITPDDIVASEADGKIEFTITRPDDRLDIAETVYISTNGIDGSSNDGDFIGPDSNYTFGVGEKTSAPVAIHILSDTLVEDDETFGVIVQDAFKTPLTETNFTISDSVAEPPGSEIDSGDLRLAFLSDAQRWIKLPDSDTWTATGDMIVGLAGSGKDLLRLEGGDYVITRDAFYATDVTVYSIADGTEKALFSGNFDLSLNKPAGTINATDNILDLGGVDFKYTSLELIFDTIRLGNEFTLPADFSETIPIKITDVPVVIDETGIALSQLSSTFFSLSAFKLLNYINIEPTFLEITYDQMKDKLLIGGELNISEEGFFPKKVDTAIKGNIAIQNGAVSDLLVSLEVKKILGFNGYGIKDLILSIDTAKNEIKSGLTVLLPFTNPYNRADSELFKTYVSFEDYYRYSSSPPFEDWAIGALADFQISPFKLDGIRGSFSGVAIPLGETSLLVTGFSGEMHNFAPTNPEPWTVRGSITIEHVLDNFLKFDITGELNFESITGSVDGNFLGEGKVDFSAEADIDWKEESAELKDAHVSFFSNLLNAEIDIKTDTGFNTIKARGSAKFNPLGVRIPSVVYSIQENTVDEHTQTHSLNIIGSSGNLAALSNPVVEGSSAGRTLPRQPPNNL